MARDDDGGGGGAASGRLFVLVAGLVGGGGLWLAHLEVLERGPGYAGPLLPLDHLFDALLALALLWVATSLGSAALRRFGLAPDEPLESVLVSAAVGSGLLALCVLVLGAIGLLRPVWLAALVLSVAVVARRDLARLPSRIREVGARTVELSGDPWLLALAATATAGAALFLLAHGSAPPGDWDSLMYHLEVPRRWLEEGRIFLTADSFHAAYVGPIQLLYLPLLAAGSPAAAALLNGFFALLLAGAVFSVGERLLGGESASLSVALLWASTGLLLVATTARIDTTLCFYLLLGHGFVAAALVEEEGAGRSLVLAGLILGLASGLKYHAFAYVAALAPVGVWALWRAAGSAGGRLRILGRTAGAFVLAAAPWLLMTTALVGAPFYPFFAERMIQPWLADLYGATALPGGLGPERLALLRQAREPFDLVSFFLAPERVTVEPEGVHYNVNPLLALLPLWIFHLRKRMVAALALPALLYGAIVVVPFETTNLRYLLFALPPLTLVTAFFAVDALRRVPRPTIRRTLLIGAAVACLVPTVRSGTAWTLKAPVAGQLVGEVSRQEYLAAGFPFYAGLVSAVNRTVPRDGRVLLLWEARGFHLAPGRIQDNVLTNWPLLLPHLERTGSCLEETDISHVLVSGAAIRYYVSRGTPPELLAWDRFPAFRDRCLVPLEEGAGYTLFRLE